MSRKADADKSYYAEAPKKSDSGSFAPLPNTPDSENPYGSVPGQARDSSSKKHKRRQKAKPEETAYGAAPPLKEEADQYVGGAYGQPPPELESRASGSGATGNDSLQIDPRFLIDYQELQKAEKIGQGQYGVVYRGTWRGTPVALKEMRNVSGNERAEREFRAEAVKLSRLRPHANIALLYGVCLSPFCIVTEYYANGALDRWLALQPKYLPLPVAAQILSRIASGVAHLHLEGIVHRDLATRNVLLGDGNVPKLTDFGLSRNASEGQTLQTETVDGLPLKWMAPEQLQVSTRQYSTRSDVWAFGIVCFEVLSQELPWQGITMSEAAVRTLRGERLQLPQHTPQPLVQLVHRCWAVAPEQRPSMHDIVQWFTHFSASLGQGSPPPVQSAPPLQSTAEYAAQQQPIARSSGGTPMSGEGTPGPPEIQASEIRMNLKTDMIGEGTYGKVYRAQCRGMVVAVKVPSRQELTQKQLDDFRHEVELMKQIFHPHVVLFMGACFSSDHQILTNRGFMFLDDVLDYVGVSRQTSGSVERIDWRDLKVANYDPELDRLVYDVPRRLVVKEAATLVEFANGGDGGDISVAATPEHDMYVRRDADARRTYEKVAAGILLERSERVRMCDRARNGLGGDDDDGAEQSDEAMKEAVAYYADRSKCAHCGRLQASRCSHATNSDSADADACVLVERVGAVPAVDAYKYERVLCYESVRSAALRFDAACDAYLAHTDFDAHRSTTTCRVRGASPYESAITCACCGTSLGADTFALVCNKVYVCADMRECTRVGAHVDWRRCDDELSVSYDALLSSVTVAMTRLEAADEAVRSAVRDLSVARANFK